MWTQSTIVSDRQMDGRTDRITITNTVQRIASHGKKSSGSSMDSQNQGAWWLTSVIPEIDKIAPN